VRTNTNRGEAPTAAASRWRELTFTRTSAPGFAAAAAAGLPLHSRARRLRVAVDGGYLLLDERPHVRRRIHPQQFTKRAPRQRQISAARSDRRSEEQRLAESGATAAPLE